LIAIVAIAAGLASAPAPAFAAGEPTCAVLPPDNPWNTDVSQYPLHPQSDAFVDQIGRWGHVHPDFGTVWQGAPIGIPYVIVGGAQPAVPVSFYYPDESDPGPYPVPPNAPIEGGPNSNGDRHVIVIDDANCLLYEMFDATPVNGGQSWDAGSGAVFDLGSNALRPDFWTSADAAGLPIFPGLVRYEEVVEQGVIDHALRFTIAQTQRAFMHPATHFASNLTASDVPPMGLRFRMKAGYDCSAYSTEAQVVCVALKKYGMFVADNGSDWYISGAPDPRWSDDNLGDLKLIPGDAFEVVDTNQPLITDNPAGDNDWDGFSNATEEYLGTGPQDPCGGSGWPADLVPGGFQPNALNVQDLGSFLAPFRRLGTSPGDGAFSQRWDLVPGSAFGPHIAITDLAALVAGPSGFPPMLDGQRAFNQTCPYAP